MKEADIKIELLTQERNMAHTDKAEIKEQAALDKSTLVDSNKAKVDSINSIIQGRFGKCATTFSI